MSLQNFTSVLLVCNEFIWEASNDKRYKGSKITSVFNLYVDIRTICVFSYMCSLRVWTQMQPTYHMEHLFLLRRPWIERVM
jgi:hypothetical protein